MITITFCNKKGGVAKTTSSLCVADCLGYAGYKVLAIDLDPQANFTRASAGEQNVMGVYDFMKKSPLEDVVQRGPNSNYDFIGADRRLEKADTVFSQIGRESFLRKALKNVPQDKYDFIVIDTPPAMGFLTLNAIVASDYLVLCCNSDGFSIQGLAELKQDIDEIREAYNENLAVAGILLTCHNPKEALSKKFDDFFNKAADSMQSRVFENFIRKSVSLKQAAAMQTGICDFDKSSNGFKDYNAFTKELLQIIKI